MGAEKERYGMESKVGREREREKYIARKKVVKLWTRRKIDIEK